jgi:hypothetical protein
MAETTLLSVDEGIMKKSIVVVLCLLMMAMAAHARENETEVVKQKITTERGDLRIIQLDEGRVGNEFAVRLNGRVVVKTGGKENSSGFRFHDYPLPNVILHINKGVAPFDEVFVLQQRMWGNACDGGPIWFLGDKSDGSYAISDAIDYCGGPPPILTVLPEKVTVTVPGHAPHRGEGFTPQEVWVYEDGKVSQVKKAQKKKK